MPGPGLVGGNGGYYPASQGGWSMQAQGLIAQKCLLANDVAIGGCTAAADFEMFLDVQRIRRVKLAISKTMQEQLPVRARLRCGIHREISFAGLARESFRTPTNCGRAPGETSPCHRNACNVRNFPIRHIFDVAKDEDFAERMRKALDQQAHRAIFLLPDQNRLQRFPFAVTFGAVCVEAAPYFGIACPVASLARAFHVKKQFRTMARSRPGRWCSGSCGAAIGPEKRILDKVFRDVISASEIPCKRISVVQTDEHRGFKDSLALGGRPAFELRRVFRLFRHGPLSFTTACVASHSVTMTFPCMWGWSEQKYS